MCGLKDPHDWHQDRFNADFRWKALPPFADRQASGSSQAGEQRA